jgi:hypothetical protein
VIEPQLTLNCKADRDLAIRLVLDAQAGSRVVLKDPKRTVEQNAKLSVLLTKISKQVALGGVEYDMAEWKLIFLSALSRELRHEARIIRGIYGEPVNLGRSTSKLDKKVFSDLIELVYAFGAEHGVNFGSDEAEAAA